MVDLCDCTGTIAWLRMGSEIALLSSDFRPAVQFCLMLPPPRSCCSSGRLAANHFSLV